MSFKQSCKKKGKINIANNLRIYPYVFLNLQFRCRIYFTQNKEVGLCAAIWLYLLSNLVQVSRNATDLFVTPFGSDKTISNVLDILCFVFYFSKSD